jgi:HSP20 family protein
MAKQIMKTNEMMAFVPEICSYTDDDEKKIYLEVSLPGTRKSDIDLRISDDEFSIIAPRQDKNYKYQSSMSFCCDVEPGKAKANFEDGLLKIEVPIKNSMKNAVKVSVK